jgi:hypothetical protein
MIFRTSIEVFLLPEADFSVYICKEGGVKMGAKKALCRLVVFCVVAGIFCLSSIKAQSKSDADSSFETVSILPTDIGCRLNIYDYCPNGSTHVTAPNPFQPNGHYRSCGDVESLLRDAFNTGSKVKIGGASGMGAQDSL